MRNLGRQKEAIENRPLRSEQEVKRVMRQIEEQPESEGVMSSSRTVEEDFSKMGLN